MQTKSEAIMEIPAAFLVLVFHFSNLGFNAGTGGIHSLLVPASSLRICEEQMKPKALRELTLLSASCLPAR